MNEKYIDWEDLGIIVERMSKINKISKEETLINLVLQSNLYPKIIFPWEE